MKGQGLQDPGETAQEHGVCMGGVEWWGQACWDTILGLAKGQQEGLVTPALLWGGLFHSLHPPGAPSSQGFSP